MPVQYHCHHLSPPSAPLPPSYPSSSSSVHPLPRLLFCEECDAVRCDQCVTTEIAGYYCPNCTFDVPGANVRGDRNRCARNCFACPVCSTALQVQPTGTISSGGEGAAGHLPNGPPYILSCTSCRWSSAEIGLKFDKSTGMAMQLQKMITAKDTAQPEFDALRDLFEAHLASTAASSGPSRPGGTRAVAAGAKTPTRHISHLTQAAAKALQREVPGLAAAAAGRRGGRVSAAGGGAVLAGREGEEGKYGWDEVGEYVAKETWRAWGLERGLEDVESMRRIQEPVVDRSRRVERSWQDEEASMMVPDRIPLRCKLTKRCPHPDCRHLLIQPDIKSTRMKIKMVAGNYLPVVEVGRRRRRAEGSVGADAAGGRAEGGGGVEEEERRRRERRRTRGRVEEVDEEMDAPLVAGQSYSFQIAFTNPLYDAIQIRLSHSPPAAPPLIPPNYTLHIPTPHFVVHPLKDTWAYEDEDDADEDDLPDFVGTEGASEDGSVRTSTRGTVSSGKRNRLSVLGTSSAAGLRERERRRRGEGEVERKGNVSKVGLELDVLPDAKGQVQFDLEVRYTYRAEDGGGDEPENKAAVGAMDKDKDKDKGRNGGKEVYKTFTFWVRVDLGVVE